MEVGLIRCHRLDRPWQGRWGKQGLPSKVGTVSRHKLKGAVAPG